MRGEYKQGVGSELYGQYDTKAPHILCVALRHIQKKYTNLRNREPWPFHRQKRAFRANQLPVLWLFCIVITMLHASFLQYRLRNLPTSLGTVKYFSQKRLCKNEVLRREVRRGGCQAPLICPVAYSGGGVKGAASAAFIGVTGYGHAGP